MPQPPPLLENSTLEALRALQREEYDIIAQLNAYHDSLFRSYRDELNRWFVSHMILHPDQPAAWDSLAARQDGVVEDATDSFDELATAITDEDEDTFGDELDSAVEEGHNRMLWLLALGGLPSEDYADSLPPDDERNDLLLAAGIGGLSWLDRMANSRQDASGKMSQWLRATVYGGRTFEDTLQGVTTVTNQYDNRLTSLFGNEYHRAYGLGADVALEAVRQDYEIEEVWVTRQDGLVCPICRALHLTVTAKQPITDSHPGCRCRKVPVPFDYRENPVEYQAFLQQLGARA